MIKAIAQFETNLASGISPTSTTVKLISNLTNDDDGATLPNGDYGFVIDSRNSNREYVIATVSGYDLTFTKRGLSYIDGDTVKTGNKKSHRKGASIKITSFPILVRMLEQMNGAQSLDGVLKLPSARSITDPRHITDKEYVDAIVSSGISSLAVSDNGGITVNINSGYYSLNGVTTYYAGASNQSLTDNATNYIELVDGALSINTTAFSNDGMPLATVVTLSGDITSLVDARAVLGWLDIKASNGIGRDSSGIFIDLATNSGLELSSGKLRVKIKTSGGITRDGDGLSVDTEIIATKAALDASLVIPNQIIPYYSGAEDTAVKIRTSSSADGSVLYKVALTTASTVITLYRYIKLSTGQYIQTHSTDYNVGSTINTFSVTAIGNYVYLNVRTSAPVESVRRYDSADLANVATVTISGTGFDDGTVSFTDGTNLYIYSSTDKFKKYTISGLTITYDSEITYTGANVVSNGGAASDGTYVYMMAQTSTSIIIKKYAFTGGAALTTGSTYIIKSTAYQDDGGVKRLFFYKAGYLGVAFAYQNYGYSGGMVKKGAAMQIQYIPVS